MALLDAGIEPVEFENEDGFINVEVKYIDNIKTREVIESVEPSVDYELDESGWYAKDMITLEGEDYKFGGTVSDLKVMAETGDDSIHNTINTNNDVQ